MRTTRGKTLFSMHEKQLHPCCNRDSHHAKCLLERRDAPPACSSSSSFWNTVHKTWVHLKEQDSENTDRNCIHCPESQKRRRCNKTRKERTHP